MNVSVDGKPAGATWRRLEILGSLERSPSRWRRVVAVVVVDDDVDGDDKYKNTRAYGE